MPVGYETIDYSRLEQALGLPHRRVALTNAVRRSLRPTDVDSHLGCVYPLNDDEVIYTQSLGASPYVARYNIRTKTFTWRVTEFTTPFGIDYNPLDDIVAVAHNSGIALLRGRDGNMVKNITSVGTYTLPWIYNAVFNPSNPDELYFTVPGRHVLIRLNHITREYTMFGTWNTYKTDYTGLYSPWDVEVDPPNNDVLVCDTANNRVLRLDMNLSTVKDLMLLPSPAYVRKMRWGLTTQQYRLTVIGSTWGGFYPMYTFGFWRGRRLKFYIPMQLDMPRFSPDFSGMWGCEGDCYEFDVDALNELYIRHAETAILLSNASIATTGYTSPPLVPFLFGNEVLVVLKSNQLGTLGIQVPDSVSVAFPMGLLPVSVPTTFSWVDYDTVSTAAGVTRYTFSEQPPPVFRIVYKPNTTALVTLHVTFYP
jgi:hypothetical protein